MLLTKTMISIRKTEKKDLAAVYALIMELAVYEKEPEAVTASLTDYERDFEAGFFRSLVAEVGGEIVGTAVYYPAYSTWKGRMLYLEDFVVTQSYRRKGLGELIFEEVIEEARRMGANRMKWQVLDWNDIAIKFYEKYDAEMEDGWLNANFTKTQLDGELKKRMR